MMESTREPLNVVLGMFEDRIEVRVTTPDSKTRSLSIPQSPRMFLHALDSIALAYADFSYTLHAEITIDGETHEVEVEHLKAFALDYLSQQDALENWENEGGIVH